MRKSLIPALLIASALAAPAFAFAQDNDAVTRSQVNAQVVQLQHTGYAVTENDNYYPRDIQKAEHTVAGQDGVSTSSYGSSTSGTSASGMRAYSATPVGTKPVYFGH